MSIFGKPHFKKFEPKTIKMSDLYGQTSKYKDMPISIKKEIKKTLNDVGVSDDKANMVVEHDKPLTIKQMRAVTEQLHESNIIGFENDPKLIIKNYVKKETARRMNIARRRQEHMMEAISEDIEKADPRITSLSRKNDSPNLPDTPKTKPKGGGSKVNLPF